MHALRNACAAAAFIGLSLTTSFAYADESTAETLFQDGLAAMKKGDYPTACEAFSKSNKADPSPGTQINLALCYENEHKWASAWTWYRSAAGLAEQRNQAPRKQTAEESATRLQPKLHYVVIAVKDPPKDMVVKRDGAEVIVSLGGKEVPLPIDPGDHTLDITATAKKPFAKTITMADNALTDRVDVTLEDAPVDPNAPATGPGGTTIIERTDVVNDGSTQRTIGIIVGGAGVLTALAAIGVYALAAKQASDRDDLKATQAKDTTNPGQYTSAINSKNDAANNDQLISLILAGGAVVMVGVGAVLYFTAPKGKKEKTGYLVPTPVAGPGYGGFGLTGVF